MVGFFRFTIPILILATLFQNCTPMNFKSPGLLESVKSSSNGENYDGEIFVDTDIEHPGSDHKANSTIPLVIANTNWLEKIVLRFYLR